MTGPRVTSQNIVAFEKHLAGHHTRPAHRQAAPPQYTPYLSVELQGVFTVAVQQFLIDTNPMDRVALGSKIESKRQPYSVEQEH